MTFHARLTELLEKAIKIPDVDGYLITPCGTVISVNGWPAHPGPIALKPQSVFGYSVIRIGSERKKFKVHSLVLRAFVGPRPKGMQIRHINGIKSDNRLENLAYGTAKENAADRKIHGTERASETGKKYAHKTALSMRKHWESKRQALAKLEEA